MIFRGCCSSLDPNQSKEEQFPVKKLRVEKCDCLLPEKVPNHDSTDDGVYKFLAAINFTDEQLAKYIEHVKLTEGWDMNDVNSNSEEDSSEEDRAIYLQQICQSGGFDVDNYPETEDFGVIAPLLDFKEDPDWLTVSNQCSKLAIKDHNERKNTNYEFVDVEKVNIQAVKGFNCWITFLAKDLNDPDPTAEPKTFQAKVYYGIGEISIDECHLKESSQ